MKTALNILAGHWLAFGFIGAALVAFLLVFLYRRRLGRWFRAAVLACAVLALPGVGAVALTDLQAAAPIYLGWGLWLLLAGAAVLFILVVLLLLTGWWSKWAALAAGAAALLGLGGWALDPTAAALADWFAALATVEFVRPLWLFLLLLAPLAVLIAWRPPFRFESVRPWVAAALFVVARKPVSVLNGYVRTTPKPSALVEIPIRTPKFPDQEFPLLADWHYRSLSPATPASRGAGRATGRGRAACTTGSGSRSWTGRCGRPKAPGCG